MGQALVWIARRRFTNKSDDLWIRTCSSGGTNRSPYAQIGSATANIATHGALNIGIGRLLFLLEQRGGAHELTRLAVATLGHIVVYPRLLQGMQLAIGRCKALDGRYFLIGHSGQGQ